MNEGLVELLVMYLSYIGSLSGSKIWSRPKEVSKSSMLEVGFVVSIWLFSNAFSSIEAFTFLDEDNLVLGRPKTNGLNPSPRL